MAVIIRIPSPFQVYTAGREAIEVGTGTLSEALASLEQQCPGIAERILDNGRIRSFLNVYVNDEDIRFLQGERTEVRDGDEVVILPAIAGGGCRQGCRDQAAW
ncbi:MAG TPA: MoaD/ThiS family protein [Dissulfurispiraceae bacterium]|nr:MoaD/ThiS family protein [Dissulfurispiraceae bacterium]